MQHIRRSSQVRAVAVRAIGCRGARSSRGFRPKRSGDGRDAFTATSQPKAVCGGRRQADGGADGLAHDQLRLGTARPELGAVTDQLDRNIGNVKAGGSYARSSFGQEGCTWRFGPLRVSCAVVAAKIAEPGSAQQGITGCMGDHVTVGVTVGTYFIFEQHTSNVHRPSWCQPMNVDANSGATRG
jgi:hypothetical protein